MKKVLVVAFAALSLMGLATANSFINVPITSIATDNASIYYQNYPSGSQTFGGVPFQVEPNLFFTDDGGLGAGNPTHASLSTSVQSPLTAHILIIGTNIPYWFNGLDLGYITFAFQNGTQQIFNLIIGDTIRDWCTSPYIVTTTSNPTVTTVWQDYPYPASGIINKLSIPLLQGSTLTGITFDDTSQTTCNSAAPGFYVNGITIEAVPEPSSILMLVCGLGGVIWRKRRNVA